jgi:DNA-binding CsgD family transcriptional regulator
MRGVLVERDRELAVIDRVLEDARAGDGGVLVINAPAGHGKTRLMTVAGDRARAAGLGVLGAQATELEREFPFGVAVQLLEPLWLAADAQLRARWSAGAATAAAELLDGRLSSEPSAGGGVPFALIHGLFSLVRNLGTLQHPPDSEGLVMLIDDAQWADGPSWRFLAYLAERIAALPLAVVVAVRAGESGPEPRALSALHAAAGRQVLSPQALSDTGVAALVRARLPQSTSPFISTCAEVTSGNPFLLTKLIDEVLDDQLTPNAATAETLTELTPDAVLASVISRLGALPGECLTLARTLAVLGDGTPVSQVAELAELAIPTAAGAADMLAAHHLLRPGAPLSFAHPLIQSSVRAAMPPLERARAHRRAALMLLERGASAEAVAAQLLHAPPESDPRAIAALVSAARHAMASGAPDSAVRLLERARAEQPQSDQDAELLGELAEAEAASGSPAAVTHLQQAIARSASKARRDELKLVLVNAYLGESRYDEAAAVVTDSLHRGSSPAPVGELDLALLATARFVPALRERARSRGRELMTVCGAEPSVLERRALAEAAINGALDGEPHGHVRAMVQRAWDDGALLSPAPPHDWRMLTSALYFIDELELGIELCDAALERGQEPGADELRILARSCRAWPLYAQGRITEALADARAALDWLPKDWIHLPRQRTCFGALALCLIDRGELEQAETALSILDHPGSRETVHYPALLDGRARLRLAQLRPEDALRDAAAAGRACAELGFVTPGAVPWRTTQALALIALGEHQQAQALAGEALELAREIGVGRIVARATRCLGLASRGKAREQLLRSAVELCEELPQRREHIECLLAWGAALRRSNQRAAAREPLQRAYELAHAGGATVLADAARAELDATGARARRMLTRGAPSLTPRELSVAQLASSGQTTRAMAEALFVSPKTIEYHLRQIYRKLEISSRGQLAAALEPGDG